MNDRQNSKRNGNADQRRYVTILFSDISHSTQLGEASDPEDSAHVVRTVKSAAMRIISKFGGTVTQFHGDGILALFGYPSTQEDDVQRAAEAALELHSTVIDLDLDEYLPPKFSLKMHTGIESGLVLIRQGDFLDGMLELVGDAVNTAAGLCSAAKENEIIASAATLRSVAPFFETIELEPLKLKGKNNLVPAFKILTRSKVKSRFEASQLRGLTSFCGRIDELNSLKEHMRLAASGNMQIVRIIGDPGMGKTRLLDEFANQAKSSGYRIHRGRCEPTGSVAPLHPFLQMLRAYFKLETPNDEGAVHLNIEDRLRELDKGLLDHSDAFFNALAVPSPKKQETATKSSVKLAMEAPLEKWFIAQASQEPIVIVVDDWQWVDDASRNVLNYLIREAKSSRILILLALRDLSAADVGLDASELIKLEPIGEAETGQIVAALLQGQLKFGVAEKLHIKSGGNPLFLEELCQSYPEWSQQEEEAVVGSVVPATLQGLIETRVQRLPDKLIELAHTASVIGNIIPIWILKRLIGLEGTDEIFRQLSECDLIYRGEIQGTLQFKHGITRETIYATVGLRRRRQLHLEIAAILEEFNNLEEHYENLAYHHAAGASYEKALEYAELAGNKALASSSLDQARQQFEAALNAIDKLPQSEENQRRWISISGKWALPCVYGPEVSQLETLQRTVDYAIDLNDFDGLAHSYYWQGYISHVLGNQLASIDFYNKALAAARQANNNRLAVQVVATLGQSHAAASNYTEALGYLNQAIEEKREHPTKFRIRVGSSYALSSKALALGDLGRFDESHQCSNEALARVGGQGHEIESSILNNQGTVSIWQGRWDDAIRLSAKSKIIAEQVSGAYLYACASAINAYARWMFEEDEKSIDQLRQSISWVEDKGMYLYSSFFYGWISDALISVGEIKDACHFADLGLARADLQDRVGEAMSFRTLARAIEIESIKGLKDADFYLDAAWRSATNRKSPHEVAVTQMLKIKVLARKGSVAEAMSLGLIARDAFDNMNMAWHRSKIDLLLTQIESR